MPPALQKVPATHLLPVPRKHRSSDKDRYFLPAQHDPAGPAQRYRYRQQDWHWEMQKKWLRPLAGVALEAIPHRERFWEPRPLEAATAGLPAERWFRATALPMQEPA